MDHHDGTVPALQDYPATPKHQTAKLAQISTEALANLGPT